MKLGSHPHLVPEKLVDTVEVPGQEPLEQPTCQQASSSHQGEISGIKELLKSLQTGNCPRLCTHLAAGQLGEDAKVGLLPAHDTVCGVVQQLGQDAVDLISTMCAVSIVFGWVLYLVYSILMSSAQV
eukprot:2011800-Amphidinium_carterae.1